MNGASPLLVSISITFSCCACKLMKASALHTLNSTKPLWNQRRPKIEHMKACANTHLVICLFVHGFGSCWMLHDCVWSGEGIWSSGWLESFGVSIKNFTSMNKRYVLWSLLCVHPFVVALNILRPRVFKSSETLPIQCMWSPACLVYHTLISATANKLR